MMQEYRRRVFSGLGCSDGPPRRGSSQLILGDRTLEVELTELSTRRLALLVDRDRSRSAPCGRARQTSLTKTSVLTLRHLSSSFLIVRITATTVSRKRNIRKRIVPGPACGPTRRQRVSFGGQSVVGRPPTHPPQPRLPCRGLNADAPPTRQPPLSPVRLLYLVPLLPQHV